MFKAHINNNRIQDCNTHSKNTAVLSASVLSDIGLEHIAYLCGLIHDMGKYTDEFTSYIEAATNGDKIRKGSVIHTFAAVQYILKKYHMAFGNSEQSNLQNSIAAEVIAIAVGSHHGLFDIFSSDSESGFEHRLSKQPDYDQKAANSFFQECISEKEFDQLFWQSRAEIESILGKCINLTKDYCEFTFYLHLFVRLLCSAVIDGDRRDTADFMSDGTLALHDYSAAELSNIWYVAVEHLEQIIKALPAINPINKARREMSDYCASFAENGTGVYRLELPTGAGKTLSSLRYALRHAKIHNKKRLIFAVPLLSVLDQNAVVIRNAIGNDEIILEHHSNVILEETSHEKMAVQELLIDTWNSPVIITTLVQLLNTFFDGKTSSVRRFHCLTDSVIVIDEVQSVPEKMISLFNMAVNFLSQICNTTVILCSATQPLLELNTHKLMVSEKTMIPTKQMDYYRRLFKRNTARYEGECDYSDITKIAVEHLNNYGSVLIICNTKREAAELFKLIRLQNIDCLHLSTSMCMAHRKAVLKQMADNLVARIPFICVSTQLIEAGVDVSFGSVIRLTAGIDNIVQAAGRCNRNMERNNTAPVSIVSLKNENLKYLKEIKRSQDITSELISEYKKRPDYYDEDLLSDKSIRYYYDRYFDRLNSIKEYTDFSVDGVTLFDLLSDNKANTQLFSPEKIQNITMRQAFMTAGRLFKVFDDNQITVIVPYEKGADLINTMLSAQGNNIGFMKQCIKESGEYSVNMYQYQFDILKKQQAVFINEDKTFYYLNADYYDPDLGITLEKEEKYEWNTLIL